MLFISIHIGHRHLSLPLASLGAEIDTSQAHLFSGYMQLRRIVSLALEQEYPYSIILVLHAKLFHCLFYSTIGTYFEVVGTFCLSNSPKHATMPRLLAPLSPMSLLACNRALELVAALSVWGFSDP